MRTLALSTMYAQQERFADGAAFARYAAGAGYDAIEVSHSTPEPKLRRIVASAVPPVTAIHLPAPHATLPDGRANADLNLAAIDGAERADALAHALHGVGWAAAAGSRALAVHLGEVADAFWPEGEAELRRLHGEGAIASRRADELRAELAARREAGAPAALAAARASLGTLVAAARPHGIVVGVENRLRFHEIPHPRETLALLDGFAPDEAGHWHDTGHAEVLDRLGFMPHGQWFELLGERLAGAHVHDVRGLRDHRAPGAGELDWPAVAAALAPLDAWTLEIDQREPDDAVRAAIPFLRALG